MNIQVMNKAMEHLEAALALLDIEGQHASAAQLDHVMHELQAYITAASDA